MINYKAVVLASSLAFSSIQPALSQPSNVGKGYMGIGISFASLDFSGLTSNYDQYDVSVSNNTLLGAIIGYKFTPYTAVEFRGYGNVSEGDYMGYQVSVDHYFALYGRLIYPLNEDFEVYGLLGYGKQQATVLNVSDSDSDVAYGIGFQVMNGSSLALQVEWVKTYDENYSGYDSDLGNYNMHIKESNINVNLIYEF
ncbi:outer membrane beta-barrel protein [Shewanella sp. A32]|uniref:outer membrane beta-barrel protein n=1 Tax=Shewanella sp. A32 TaxID=3031327 RepID=UPI0023BA1E68|nr:outer membrane beta-barrel protein [Shewanella sp. A32]MDF0535661.1 outer membrane beta-barrel protein [Shewanella sp. A32]